MIGFLKSSVLRDYTEKSIHYQWDHGDLYKIKHNLLVNLNFSNRNLSHFRASTVITVNCNLPKISYSTLRTLLLLQIYQAIYQKREVQVANDSINYPNIEPDLPNYKVFQQSSILRKVTNQTSVATYRSTIALQLAAKSTQTRTEIAAQIVQFFQRFSLNSSEGNIEELLLRDFTVSNTESGQLEFAFGDSAIALWLQTVLDECTTVSENPNAAFLGALAEDPQIFFCQYSYARCAAICRLVNTSKFMRQRVEIEWLRDGKLLFRKERSLVSQIVTTLDDWETGEVLKNAIALSRAFQVFYRDCQIVKYETVDPQIAQGRLALVMITQWLLKRLLEKGLSVLAPETL